MARSIPYPGKLIDVGGRNLHALLRGKGDPLVVFEAGIAASSLSWALVEPAVAEFTSVLSYDRAGLGWSDPAPHRSAALDAARDLALLLDALGYTKSVLLVGHSFGGVIARIFQQQYRERVCGMVLLDPVAPGEWRDMPAFRKTMLARGVALSRPGETLARAGVVGLALRMLLNGSAVIPKMMGRASAAKGGLRMAERLAREVGKLPRELWPAVASHWSQARCFRAMGNALESLPISVHQIEEKLPLGDFPLVVLSAADSTRDAILEHAADARLSTRGRHLVLANTGHWIPLDAPAAVVGAIKETILEQVGCERSV